MKKSYEYLATLIKAQLEGITVLDIPEVITVDEIMKIANENHMVHLLLGGLVRANNVEEEDKKRLRTMIMRSIIKSTAQIQEHKALEKRFEEDGIMNQPMKGSILRFYYPSPEMREMGDIDMLIAAQDMEKAQVALAEMGYELVQAIKHHDIYCKKPFMVLEAHRTLYDKTVDKNQFGYFTNFSRTRLKEGSRYTYEFGDEDFYVYMMAHMAKHFYQMGCGVRHLVDIYIYLNRFGESMDRKYVEVELERCGILDFTKHMEKLSAIWLGGEESTPLYDDLFEYMLGSGIYGKDENGIWNRLAKGKNKDKEISQLRLKIWYFFPPLSYMAEDYHYLDEKPWLLPWAWLVRGVNGILHKKGVYKREMIQTIEKDDIKRLKNIYEEMNLTFKA